MSNKFIVAAAGSGKTTMLVDTALSIKDERVLITTYTRANEKEIRNKIIEKNKCIPENITVQTWFAFLLKHGVRPYQPSLFEKKINGLLLVNSQSGLKFKRGKKIIYFSEEREFEQHYFTKDTKIYSDKISKFIIRCDEKINGVLFNRISRIFTHIFIDEVQDLAGYDLDILSKFFKSESNILLVGDPRQGTYSTNSTNKNNKYKKSKIIDFFYEREAGVELDETSLLHNYRCVTPICDLSNKLFNESPQAVSHNSIKTNHDGVFFIKKDDLKIYLEKYNPMQLRDSRRTPVNSNYNSMNFGESKGLTFERVLIYPTIPMINWLKDNSAELAPTSRSKLYVALTRARQSVAIVYDYSNTTNIEGIVNYAP